MGDSGELSEIPCFHFDRPSPDALCPRCGMPGEKVNRAALELHRQAQSAASLVLLGQQPPQTPMRVLGRAALPAQSPEVLGKVLERLVADHARIVISTAREISSGLIPVGSKPVVVQAGGEVDVEMWTEMPVHGPYRIGIQSSARLRVRDIRIGNVLLNLGVAGEIAQEHLKWQDSDWPLGLVPIRGPSWGPGTRLSVRLHNTSCFTDEVTITVWACPDRPETLKVPTTGAVTLRLSEPVVGSTFEIRGAGKPEPGDYWVTNETSNEIRLRHEEPASVHTEFVETARRKLKHLSARISQLNGHLDKERGRADDLERALRIERERRGFYEKMNGEAAEERLRTDRDRASGPATITWFGPSWDAPLCLGPDAHRALLTEPGAQICAGCGANIESDQPGILLSKVMSPSSAWHRDCWFVHIGAKEPEPGTVQAFDAEGRRRRAAALESYMRDERASRAEASRLPAEDEDGWSAWESATDEGP